MSNKEILEIALKELLTDRDATALDRYWAPSYIQHNPMMPDGVEVIRQMLTTMPDFNAKIVRYIAEGDYVVTHGQALGMGPTPLITFEIFRFKDGKMVEHWDAMLPQAETTISGRSQIDGPTEITDLDKTAANKKLIENFFDDVLYNHKMEKLTDYISTETYHQHNPGVGDGLAGFGKAMSDLAAHGLSMEYKKTYRTIAEGNFVFTHSEGTFAGRHVAFADLFRIEAGKIVEHWDVISDVTTGGAKNSNGGF
jgi:predicted SnoaL-like aldol condensation-catalyzing enzyme